jgi:hypothetical protein
MADFDVRDRKSNIIPDQLRMKVIYRLEDSLKGRTMVGYDQVWSDLEKGVKRQYGLSSLAEGSDDIERVENYIKSCSKLERFVYVVALFLRRISRNTYPRRRYTFEENMDFMNKLFAEYDIGFQFVATGDTKDGCKEVLAISAPPK